MRLGIDLGGTKIEAAVLDRSGNVLVRDRVATPQGDYAGTLAAIGGLIDAAEDQIRQKFDQLGVGIPGSLSPETGLVRNANSTVLNGRPFDRDLAEATGRTIRVENDANCFALAEAVAGAGQGASVVLGLILGTGVGSGLIVDARVVAGANRIAGEWGHMPLPYPREDERPGRACFCGRHGCIETWVSGPALRRHHGEASGMIMDVPEIVMAARAGDATAAESLTTHLDRLARGLSQVVNVLDPDVIVLGGGLSNLPGLAEALPDAMRPFIFSDCFSTPIRTNSLGDSAGVIGAAWLWPDHGAPADGAL